MREAEEQVSARSRRTSAAPTGLTAPPGPCAWRTAGPAGGACARGVSAVSQRGGRRRPSVLDLLAPPPRLLAPGRTGGWAPVHGGYSFAARGGDASSGAERFGGRAERLSSLYNGRLFRPPRKKISLGGRGSWGACASGGYQCAEATRSLPGPRGGPRVGAGSDGRGPFRNPRGGPCPWGFRNGRGPLPGALERRSAPPRAPPSPAEGARSTPFGRGGFGRGGFGLSHVFLLRCEKKKPSEAI